MNVSFKLLCNVSDENKFYLAFCEENITTLYKIGFMLGLQLPQILSLSLHMSTS